MATGEDVAVIIVDEIDTAVAGLTKGTNLFRGPMRAVDPDDSSMPALACFVDVSGGEAPQVYLDGGSGENLQIPGIQIMVRSNAKNRTSGKTIADEVYAATKKINETGILLGTEADQSSPFYLGDDETGHHMWSINLTAYYRG